MQSDVSMERMNKFGQSCSRTSDSLVHCLKFARREFYGNFYHTGCGNFVFYGILVF